MGLSSRQTKIIATIGPASARPSVLRRLIEEGVNVIRLNFAHGRHETHAHAIRSIRSLDKGGAAPVGVLVDLPGPKLRVGALPNGSMDLKREQSVILSTSARRLGASIPITYSRLAQDLKPGHPVFVADGIIRLVVEAVRKGEVHCRVTHGGTVRTGNGVNMPHSPLSLGAFTKEDERHLAFALRQEIDFVGISFVASARDVEKVRAFCRRRGSTPMLIAKIERRQALDHFDEILASADGIMVARGDLGVEVPFDQIPGVQADIVARSHRMGKPVIVATQVLESMIQNPRPTRAEATDVANAIREGADAVMLSGETSVGKFPVAAVSVLARVICSAEARPEAPESVIPDHGTAVSGVMAHEACHVAERIRADLIVVPTVSGRTAQRISRFRPRMPVLALASDMPLRRRFSLFRGIQTLSTTRSMRYDNAHALVRALLVRNRLAKKGQMVLIVSGAPGLPVGQTGMIQLLRI